MNVLAPVNNSYCQGKPLWMRYTGRICHGVLMDLCHGKPLWMKYTGRICHGVFMGLVLYVMESLFWVQREDTMDGSRQPLAKLALVV